MPEFPTSPASGADLNALAAAIGSRCRLSGEFTLRSGRIATEYFDKYLFEADPGLLHAVVAAMVPLVPASTEVLGGLELGGVPLATLLGQLTGIPVAFIRKQPKPYGTRRLAEGADCAGRSVLLVEDVITTGGAALNAARALRAMSATVAAVVCAIDRQEPGADQLDAEGIEIRPVFTRRLLDTASAGG